MTVLRDATAALETSVNEILGDEITYTPEGGEAQTFNCWVAFDNDHIRAGGSTATARVRSIEVPKSRIPTPDATGDRITITVLPGETFRPKDVLEGEGAATWIIPLQKVRDA